MNCLASLSCYGVLWLSQKELSLRINDVLAVCYLWRDFIFGKLLIASKMRKNFCVFSHGKETQINPCQVNTYGLTAWSIAIFKSLAKCEISTTESTISWTAVTLGKFCAAFFVFMTQFFNDSDKASAHDKILVLMFLFVTLRCTISPMFTKLWALKRRKFFIKSCGWKQLTRTYLKTTNFP